MATTNMTKEEFNTKAFFDPKDKVWRWKSNGRIPPEECLDVAGITDVNMRQKMAILRLVEFNDVCAKYVERQRELYVNPDLEEERTEQLFEMRAAFGPDTEVMNVITGQIIRT